MIELTTFKPCPFCGEPYGTTHKDDCYISLMRENLMALLMGWQHSPNPKEIMQKAWNRRYEGTCKNIAPFDSDYFEDDLDIFECSECGFWGVVDDCSYSSNWVTKHCPDCGARIIDDE